MSWSNTSIEVMQFEEIKKKDIKIKDLQKENQELRKVLRDLVDDIYTPYRLGLDEQPNPEWSALKKAETALKEIKGEQ